MTQQELTVGQKAFGWIAFAVVVSAYVPLAWSGWQHPEEINVASYAMWVIVCGTIAFSSLSMGYAAWRLPMAAFAGNAMMTVLGAFMEGSTFNIGLAERIGLFGLVVVFCAAGVVGRGKLHPRVLFLGAIAADVTSFYPIFKQYLLNPPEQTSTGTILGWVLWGLAALLSLLFVERLPNKLMDGRTSKLTALEESAFTIENIVLIAVTVVVMA